MNRDFIRTDAREFEPSPNRDRLSRAGGGPNYPMVMLDWTYWGGFDYAGLYGNNDGIPVPEGRRYQKARWTATAPGGAVRVDEIDWGNGTDDPTWQNTRLDAAFSATYGTAPIRVTLDNDPRQTRDKLYKRFGFSTPRLAGMTCVLELLEPQDDFLDQMAVEAYAALNAIEFSSVTNNVGVWYEDWDNWSRGVVKFEWLRLDNPPIYKAAVALERVTSVNGTLINEGYLDPPYIGAISQWNLGNPQVRRPDGSFHGEAGPFQAMMWHLRLSKVNIKRPRANAIEFRLARETSLLGTETGCQLDRAFINGIMLPPDAENLTAPGAVNATIAFPPYRKAWTPKVPSPTCFTPPA